MADCRPARYGYHKTTTRNFIIGYKFFVRKFRGRAPNGQRSTMGWSCVSSVPTGVATSTHTRVAEKVSQGQTELKPASFCVFLELKYYFWNAEHHQGACGLLRLTGFLGGLSLKSRQTPEMPPSQDAPPTFLASPLHKLGSPRRRAPGADQREGRTR